MPDYRRRLLILNCEGTRWRVERRQEAAMQQERSPVQMPKILPFTFTEDLLADAGIESGVVLRPAVGVKS
jgi:hypothetical protein